jgi:hypothetical protein
MARGRIITDWSRIGPVSCSWNAGGRIDSRRLKGGSVAWCWRGQYASMIGGNRSCGPQGILVALSLVLQAILQDRSSARPVFCVFQRGLRSLSSHTVWNGSWFIAGKRGDCPASPDALECELLDHGKSFLIRLADAIGLPSRKMCRRG